MGCYKFSLVFGVVGGAILFVATPVITPLFDPNPTISATADMYLRIVPWSFAFHGIVMVACAFFNGVGMPGPSLTITVVRMLCLMVPMAYLGSQIAGLDGVFWAVALANFGSGVLSVIWTLRCCRQAARPDHVVGRHESATNAGK